MRRTKAFTTLALVGACLLTQLSNRIDAAECQGAIADSGMVCDESPLVCSATPPPSCAGDWSDGLLSGMISKADHKNTGFLDFNYYWDDREFSVLTINAGAKLPHKFEYFQFVNFTSPLGDPSELEDWNDFFTEIHLRRPISEEISILRPLDWNLMWADGGFAEEVGRFGIRWRLQDTVGPLGDFVSNTLKLRYSLTFHVLEDDGSGWQMEHVFRRTFLDGLAYVAGFADHNVNDSFGNSDWVAESQVGLKLVGNFYAVAEYRYNSFLPGRFRSGWGFGLEYVVPFG